MSASADIQSYRANRNYIGISHTLELHKYPYIPIIERFQINTYPFWIPCTYWTCDNLAVRERLDVGLEDGIGIGCGRADAHHSCSTCHGCHGCFVRASEYDHRREAGGRQYVEDGVKQVVRGEPAACAVLFGEMYYQFDFAVRGKPCRVGYALGIEQLKAVREDDVLAEDSVSEPSEPRVAAGAGQ